MAKLDPYLIFNGNCREAMTFYKEIFGGELVVSTFGEAQKDACPAALKEKIMHARLTTPGFVLMASDSSPERNTKFGENIQLSLNFSDYEDLAETFHSLADGGNVSLPLQDMFWGARFGMLCDPFGIYWMLNCEHPK